MANESKVFDLGGGRPAMPSLGGIGTKILTIVGLIVFVIVFFSSVVSIPTGNVGVLTMFGRVTGEALGEGIHLINPLKAVQKMSIQTQSVKESANVPSNDGLILALDTSLLFHLDRTKGNFPTSQGNSSPARRSNWIQTDKSK